MSVSAQAHGTGDGRAVTRKANRRPVYQEHQGLGELPQRIQVGWAYDDDEPEDDTLTR
jgi:hypothetical protein